MHVNGNASPSLTLNSTTLSTNVISCTGTGKPTAPTAAGVYIGLATTAAAGIELCSTSSQYIDFTIASSDYKGRMIYSNTDSSFNWHVGGSATAKMTLNPPYMLAAQRVRQAISV